MALAAILRAVGYDLFVLYNHHAATDDAIAEAGLESRWDETRQCWIVPAENANAVIDVLEDLGYEWEYVPNHTPSWSDEVFARSPEQLHDRLLYALAIALHPRYGGDAQMFDDLVRSWRTFR